MFYIHIVVYYTIDNQQSVYQDSFNWTSANASQQYITIKTVGFASAEVLLKLS